MAREPLDAGWWHDSSGAAPHRRHAVPALARRARDRGASARWRRDASRWAGVVLLLGAASVPAAAQATAVGATAGGATAGGGAGAVAAGSGADWGTYNGTPGGERFSHLAEITTANVAGLAPVCTFRTGETANFQTGPVVIDGIMYITTDTVTFAVDAATCALRWRHARPYGPPSSLQVNRGVAYVETAAGPRLVRGSSDGAVYALDARTGAEAWDARIADPKLGETVVASPAAWRGVAFIGQAGGDNRGSLGRIHAFDVATGRELWATYLVPPDAAGAAPAEAHASHTWPPSKTADVPRTGGGTWTSYSVDTAAGLLYVPGGNPAPDFIPALRRGDDLYTGSLVAMDLRTGAIRAYVQLVHNDFHDWDMSVAPSLVTTRAGVSLAAIAGKNGYLYGIDRAMLVDAPRDGDGAPTNAAAAVRYHTPVTTISNATAPFTAQGTHFCPGPSGGTEWNGTAYDPATNTLFVNAVDWCGTVALEPMQAAIDTKRGAPWIGGQTPNMYGRMDPLSQRRGWLTAVDADDGTVRWRYQAPNPALAGVTATAGGLVFTGDLDGSVTALAAADGRVLWRAQTGGPVGGGVVSYAVGGRQRIAVASGVASWIWKTAPKNGSVVVVYGLP